VFDSAAYVADWERTGQVPSSGEPWPAGLGPGLIHGELPPVGGEPLMQPVGVGGNRLSGDDDGDSGGFRPDVGEDAGPVWPVLGELTPGPASVGLLSGIDMAMLDEYDLVEAVAGWEKAAAWVAAQQVMALAELSRRPLFRQLSSLRDRIDPVSAVAMEISARLRISYYEAARRVELAEELTTDRVATLVALRAGRIDLRRTRMLLDGARVLDHERAAQVEERLLPAAAKLAPSAFRSRVEKAVAAADPAGFEERHERALADRQVRCRPELDAMGSTWALLSAPDTALLDAVLTAAADGMKHDHPDDPRTQAQRRADALAEMARLAWRSGHLGGVPAGQRLAHQQGRRAEIGVLVPYSTLIGLSEAPGELDGYGPLPASVARRIAADGVWRRILTDPVNGRVLDYGTTRYRPPQELVDYVIARDRTCRGIACSRPARSCEIDHTIAYPDGPTADWNLGPFCGRQHLFKTHGGWQVSQPSPGYFVWRTPTGHTYTKDPDEIGPIIEDPPAQSDEAQDPDPPPF
jgi:Domain of unknown function (DUF222)